ncbi:MAG: bacteriohemerythrin [Proteobacteria bacterium]|nr:bacteriohemerythrin [Pseudomonadota bacterium]
MAFFNWSDDLATGDPRIDADHKHLIDLVNALYDAMKSGKGNDVLKKTLDELIQYTSSHFRREELLMQQIRYPDADSHKAEHVKLVAEVLDLQSRFESGAATLSVSVFNFLADWLRTHIKGRDVYLGKALKAASTRV